MERYPATTLATVVALVAISAGAAAFIEGNERLGLLLAILGPAVTTILATNRGEAGTRAARRADEGVQEAKRALADETAARAVMAPPALSALARLVEAVERAEAAAVAVEKVANGHGSGELHTRAEDPHG